MNNEELKKNDNECVDCDTVNVDEQVMESQEAQTNTEAEVDIESLTKDLKDALAKEEEYLSMAQRIQADFDNYRKRNANLRKEAFDDGKIDFVKGLLPIIDNFQRAIDSMEEHDGESLIAGVKMIYKQLLDLLEKNGITQVNRLGEIFDPKLEEVVTMGSPEDGEPGTICEVMQKGYIMNDIVIRYSMVKVVPQ